VGRGELGEPSAVGRALPAVREHDDDEARLAHFLFPLNEESSELRGRARA
jgi:hypothetical protein